MFDQERFLEDLATFVGFRTVVCENPDEFARADDWIHGFFDREKTDFIELDCHGLTTSIIRPKGSSRPNMLGDGHIEVVPGGDQLFELRERDGVLYGRGVADMKTQCLAMMWVLRRLIDEGDHNDFWLVFSEDEEVGSTYGVKVVTEFLGNQRLLPKVVFAPDGGPDFAYVEKEKGIFSFEVEVPGTAAHASRPYLGDNAIDRAAALYERLKREIPNPASEAEWVPSLSMTTIRAGSASNQIPDACTAGFDLRLTENETVEGMRERLERIVADFDAKLVVGQADPATYYPKEAPVARRYLDILRKVSGREPEILHSAGASNGRIYVARDPEIHVLMSSPRIAGAHSENESLEASSIEPFYQLVYETAKMRF